MPENTMTELFRFHYGCFSYSSVAPRLSAKQDHIKRTQELAEEGVVL